MLARMADAFTWLDTHMPGALDDPDEHFDWIAMATDEEWTRLLAAYPSRTAVWREAFVLVVAEAPPQRGYQALALGLRDAEPAVRAQAGLSFVDLNDVNEDEGADTITAAMWADLRKVADDSDDALDDLRAFLQRVSVG